MADTRPALPRPDWATDANYTSGPDNTLATKVQPLSGEFAQGFQRGSRAPARKLNWQLGKIGEWVTYLADHMLNGEIGGTWTPDFFITIAGAGLKITTTLRVEADTEISFGGTAPFIVSAASATFTCNQFFNAPARFNDTSRFEGIATFNVQPVFPAGLLVSLPGVAISDTGALIGTAVPGLVVTSASQFTKEIVLSGEGRVRKRITYAANANSNFDVTATDVLVAQSGVVLATRIYTLQDSGASDGSHIEVRNYSVSTQTIHNQGGATIATVPIFNNGRPGIAKFAWENDGTTTKWTLTELITP